MALSNIREDRKYVSVLADGLFHLRVDKDTPGAKLREYETKDGLKKSVHELTYDQLDGKIEELFFKDGDYGTQLYIKIDDVYVTVGAGGSFGSDLMKKIPNIDFDKPVTLSPYAFESEGKNLRGITVKQGGEKLTGFFYDPEKKENLHGFPKPKGDTSKYNSNKWKIYFAEVEEFLIDYIKKNHAIEPKMTVVKEGEVAPGVEYPTDGNDPDAVPW